MPYPRSHPDPSADSVYGAGPNGSANLYQADRLKLRIESGGLFEDLPRTANGSAIISDPHNDENLIISGLQCAMILTRNRTIDDLRAQGVPPALVQNLLPARTLTATGVRARSGRTDQALPEPTTRERDILRSIVPYP